MAATNTAKTGQIRAAGMVQHLPEPRTSPMVRLTDRARAALGDGEVVVFDWAALGLCCGCTGQPWLRTAPRAVAARYRGFRTVEADPAGAVLAHPLAYACLVGRDVAVDCRRRFGFRHFSCDLPPDAVLGGMFGRKPAASTSTSVPVPVPVPASTADLPTASAFPAATATSARGGGA